MSDFNLQFQNVSSYYDKEQILKDLNLVINNGEVVSIIGPNGSGKSTFLKTIMNQVKHTGSVTLNGINTYEMLERISFMPQSGDIDQTYPLSVKDVVSMAFLKKNHLLKFTSNHEFDIQKYLNALKIEDIESKSISELSGGQLQRVFLARTLAREGDLVLLDEPFNEVDVLTEKLIINQIEELRLNGKTILISNHDLPIAQKISTKILLLNKKIVAYGNPKDVFSKEALFEAFGDKIVVVSDKDFTIPDHVY